MMSMNRSYSYSGGKVSKTIQRSKTTTVIESTHGFKPTDRFDPNKKSFLTDLSKKIWSKRDEVKKPIDLQKIFTPATDTDEILPGKNRKLFASSSFYSPTIHPTVEDQVELARRISHSLSDVNNQTSKGQTMYVNRKKRSVKWIHDDGHEEERFVEEYDEKNENGFVSSNTQQQHEIVNSSMQENEPKKVPLKLLMDPRHVQDFNTVRQQYGYDQPAPMSPEFGHVLIDALNAPKGKGAELFAKRRKKAEKWVIDGTNSPQMQNVVQSPASSIIAYSDVGIQNVQRNIMMDQVQQKIISEQQRVKLVKSPWEAALETGNVDNAFSTFNQNNLQQNLQKLQQQPQQIYSATVGGNQQFEYNQSVNQSMNQSMSSSSSLYSSSTTKNEYQSSKQIKETLAGRELAYRPSVPQGWNRPKVVLPPGSYMPPDLTSMTSSYTSSSEKVTKFSSSSSTTTTSNINEVSLPPLQQPFGIQQQEQQQQPAQPKPTQKPVQKQVPVKQVPQTPLKPVYQNVPQQQQQQQQHKPQTPVMKTPPSMMMSPVSELKAPTPASRSGNASPRSGYSSGSVTPGILKKQIQLDAAVPVMPGCPSPVMNNAGILNGKSPVPFINTAPAPFGVCPGLSVQTPQTIAEFAPSTALVPPLQNPPPLPLIVNTPLPQFNSTYNNSARPFTQFKDFYRPVNMDSVNHKLVPPVIYTDF